MLPARLYAGPMVGQMVRLAVCGLALGICGCSTLPNRDPLNVSVAGIESLPGEGIELYVSLRGCLDGNIVMSAEPGQPSRVVRSMFPRIKFGTNKRDRFPQQAACPHHASALQFNGRCCEFDHTCIKVNGCPGG